LSAIAGGGVRRRRIMYLHRSMSFGAVQMITLVQIRRLDPRRFEPIICCMRDLGELGEEARSAGIETHVLGRPGRGAPDPILLRRLAGLLAERKVALLQTHSFHSHVYGAAAALLARAPKVIQTFHILPDVRLKLRVPMWLSLRRADAAVAVSRTVAALVAERYGVPRRKLRVIYNGVDVNAFAPSTQRSKAKQELGLDPSEPVVLNVARFAPVKGQRYLIEAVARMSVRPRCVLLGWGDDKENLRALATSLGVAERVIFAGPTRDVIRYLHAADVFVFPSLREGLGNALLEAMACGLPVVASDVAVLHEVAGEEEAVFVPPADSAALAAALGGLLADAGRRDALGRAARRRAEEAFTLEGMILKYQALYDELLAEAGVAA